MEYAAQIEESVRYLKSNAARGALAVDCYWPKWDSPWWHMLLLHEMGHTALIPEAVVGQHLAALNRLPLKIFPIVPQDVPAGLDPLRDTACHCQLGSVYQVLAARGVDVDAELPWVRPWFLRYQMADGGLNCDNDAYQVQGECPSSMVGTIAAFEAVLLYTDRPWTEQERAFVDQGANFLIGRELRRGSDSQHNAAECLSAEAWTKLCFPRFYFYDVLRGLTALLAWAQKTWQPVPSAAIRAVVEHLEQTYPDGMVYPERFALAGARQPQLSTFALLDAVSVVGATNPMLSRQWRDTKRLLEKLQS